MFVGDSPYLEFEAKFCEISILFPCYLTFIRSIGIDATDSRDESEPSMIRYLVFHKPACITLS